MTLSFGGVLVDLFIVSRANAHKLLLSNFVPSAIFTAAFVPSFVSLASSQHYD